MKPMNTLRASLIATIGVGSFAMASAIPLAEAESTAIIKGLDKTYPSIAITYNYEKEEKKIVYTRDGEFHIDAIPENGMLRGVTVLDKYIPIGASAEISDGDVIVTTTTTQHPDGSVTILTTITQP